MKIIKKLISSYQLPTPAKWRRVGDSLLAVCLFASPYEIVKNCHYCSIAVVCIGIIGKFLTNFFSDGNK